MSVCVCVSWEREERLVVSAWFEMVDDHACVCVSVCLCVSWEREERLVVSAWYEMVGDHACVCLSVCLCVSILSSPLSQDHTCV